jgi:polar amino acid transport system substrate-binding protein
MTDAIDQLAPTGTLRGGVVVAPAATTVCAVQENGGPRGVTADLLRFFANRLSLLLELKLFLNSGEATDAVASGACDVAFMPKDAAREARVAFGPAYFMIESAYLVPAGSAIRSIDEVNRAGVRIVAIANTTAMRSARRTAPLAFVIEVATVDAMMDMARAGEGDAFALSKDSFAALVAPGAGRARAARQLSGDRDLRRRAPQPQCRARSREQPAAGGEAHLRGAPRA